MRSFSLPVFEKLRSAVIAEAGLTSMVTADCKTVERLVFEKTKLQVSETTLKRVFGFVCSKFNPSMYTINSLAKYCGYDGWEDFYNQTEKQLPKDESVTADWEALRTNASKITAFTLQALKNKSGIPYPLTIKRKFIDEHFDDFLASGHTASVITAPAGYGKTLALCHWVDEKIQHSDHDIVLFFSSSALMNVFLTGRDMNSWMLALLGYTAEDDIQTLMDIKLRGDGRFYLIVDGIDEHMYKNDQFQIVLSQLGDIFSFYQSHQWFKLVLCMRSGTWINNRHNIELGQDGFHMGFVNHADRGANVPLFALSELNALCEKINPAVQHHIDPLVADTFRHPLYFQFFYKQNHINFSFNQADSTSVYDVVSGFVLEKVYMGTCSAEKLLLIDTMVSEMDLPAQQYQVSKIKMVSLIKQHPNAYNELLALGFLRELNTSNNFKYEANIEFVCNHFLNFAVAQSMLYKNNHLFDANLLAAVEALLPNQQLPVLKWCIYYAAKNNQLTNLDLLAQTHFNANQRLELVNFIGDLLRKEWTKLTRTHTLIQYFTLDCSDALFNFMFSLEYIGNVYVHTLQTLLKFRLSDHKKILIYTMLSIRYINRLDFEKAEEYIAQLRVFTRVDMDVFALNPLSCINAIYGYYKHGLVNGGALKEITRFMFNPPTGGPKIEHNHVNDLIYLLGLYSLKTCGNPTKNIRYVNLLSRIYKPLTDKVDLYNTFMRRALNEEYVALGQIQKAQDCYDYLLDIYTNQKRLFSPIMISSFRCIKIIHGIYGTNEPLTGENINIQMITSDHEFSSVKLYVLTFLLSHKHGPGADEHLYKQMTAEYNRAIREHGLHNTVAERVQAG